MATTSVYLDDILQAFTGVVQALPLPTPPTIPGQPPTIPGQPPTTGWTILSRFVATMHEGLATDQYPAILVVPDDSGEEPSGETFGGEMDWKYRLYVVIVHRNERDFTSNRRLYLQVRQMIRGSALVGPTLAAAPSVWDIRMQPKTPFDRRLLRQYAAMATIFSVMSHEPRLTP
jgi:hypothetical protein